MQVAWAGSGSQATRVELPDPDDEVIPGVVWSSVDIPYSPAYWAIRCRWPGDAIPKFVSERPSLIEEVGFCLLGGFGIRYEVNAAAFYRLRDNGVFDLGKDVCSNDILTLLTEPLEIEGRHVRYRFPNQRTSRLMEMRYCIAHWLISDMSPLELRAALQGLNGVGPKTASWIVRNLLGSDEVAILDVHVIRACAHIGVFPNDPTLPKDYGVLESRFLSFADGIRVRPSILDAVMWSEVRNAPRGMLTTH